jgi:DNA-binding NtrC family response regulator
MPERLVALLVHDGPGPFDSLQRALRELSIDTYSVSSCREARDLLSQWNPQVIFTESSLKDGPWVNILHTADSGENPVSVIVVAAHPDTRLYVSIMERGAFDFVAPPFEHESLRFVTRSAALDTQRRRDVMSQSARA